TTLSETGPLPSGVTFTDNTNGTATLAGTPALGTGGTYNITITATNGPGGTASQIFTLTINKATPLVTAAASGGAYNGQPFSASATATGVGGATVAGSFAFTYTDAQGHSSSTAPTNAGPYTVVASFSSSDPNYTNAQSAPVSFTIIPATPTVIASAAGGV